MARERDVDTRSHMSDHEALMWNVEQDPWLNPNGASLTILDRPVDRDRFRQQMRASVAKMPRLYQRVEPSSVPFENPRWITDVDFDLDYHLCEISLPAPGSERQLFDLAAQLYSEPLDRARPLWRFVTISGLEGGRGAIYSMVHHVISDGIGQIRMAELYQQLGRDDPPAPDVDIDAVVAKAAAAEAPPIDVGPVSPLLGAAQGLAHVLGRQIEVGRQIAGEMMMWGADPERARDTSSGVVDGVRATLSQLTSSAGDDEPVGSPLWVNRSANRHLEWVQVSVAGLKAAAHEVDASLNDAFMAGLAAGAYRYHRKRGVEVRWFGSSFVVSTRSDSAAGGNSFTPVPVRMPGAKMPIGDRIALMRDQAAAARERSASSGGISGLSGALNLLPSSVIAGVAKQQAARIDLATSNLRGAHFELYCSGAKVLAIVALGPVAGTAANVTALSYDGTLNIGVFCDPTAIEDPADLARCIDAEFAKMTGVPRTYDTRTGDRPDKNKSAKKKSGKNESGKQAKGKRNAAKTKSPKTKSHKSAKKPGKKKSA